MDFSTVFETVRTVAGVVLSVMFCGSLIAMVLIARAEEEREMFAAPPVPALIACAARYTRLRFEGWHARHDAARLLRLYRRHGWRILWVQHRPEPDGSLLIEALVSVTTWNPSPPEPSSSARPLALAGVDASPLNPCRRPVPNGTSSVL